MDQVEEIGTGEVQNRTAKLEMVHLDKLWKEGGMVGYRQLNDRGF